MDSPPIWKGRRYESGGLFGSRILVLGESAYPAPGEDTSTYNVAIPQDHISGRVRDGFRTKLLRVFLNTDRETPADIAAFWHSIAFFNYVPEAMVGPRIAPTERAWMAGSHFLPEHLGQLQPQLLVVLGYRMRDRFERAAPVRRSLGPAVVGADRPQTYWYHPAVSSQPVLAYGLQHPSSGFSWRTEHPSLVKAIQLAGDAGPGASG